MGGKSSHHHHHSSIGLAILYAGCYALLLSGLIIDNISKISWSTLTVDYEEYCGWQRTHESDYDLTQQSSSDSEYKENCEDSDSDSSSFCKQQQVGEVWFACCIVALIVGLPAWGGILLKGTYRWFSYGGLSIFLFSLCCLIAVGVWGDRDRCRDCEDDTAIDCTYDYAESWYLVLVAGLLSFFLSAVTTRL